MTGDEDITQILNEWSDGNAEAVNLLMPLVYEELRRQASRYLRKERAGHTLQTTALIHEAYLRLVGVERIKWQNRAHFYAIASTAMRRILVDHAREKNREKRGGPQQNLPLEEAFIQPADAKSVDLVELDEALGRLAELDPRQSKVVELRYFGGFTNDEVAEILGVSNATVRLDWNLARAWLLQELKR